jgi:L-2-hydroxyglutarate oxidase
MVYDICIVGGGIVGLATALQLISRDDSLQIVVLEKESGLARHQSGRNSGVIHSGIYYKPGSLKAETCFHGYRKLIEFAKNEGIPHRICGKLIAATEESELGRLEAILGRGIQNGLEGLEMIVEARIREIEPHLKAIQAIFVPQTGVIDFASVTHKYAENFQREGGIIRTGEEVVSIRDLDEHVQLDTKTGIYRARAVVVCGGLYADVLALQSDPGLEIRIIPFRGEYHVLKPERSSLVNHLIYPVPDPAFPFLGVHLTRNIHGVVEAGPSAVLAFRREGYKLTQIKPGELAGTVRFKGFRKFVRRHMRTGVSELARSFSKKAFITQVQKLVPELDKADFTGKRTGVRAMAVDAEGRMIDDFHFLEAGRIIHVLNAPSPAATASLAIGEKLAEMAMGMMEG